MKWQMKWRFILTVSALLVFAGASGVLAAEQTPLQVADCDKCHSSIVTDVAANGGLHSTAVTCLDCHLEHPPEGTDAIPECSMCHAPAASSHYQVDNCVGCHNPHHPLAIDLAGAGEINPVCVSCHENEGAQLQEYPSLHTELSCTACHQEHGKYLSCLDCHDPHVEGQTYDDCFTCHKPHKPKVIRYPETSPVSYCSGCHAQATQDLAQNHTRHHDLKCAYCHKTQHKAIPTCETCHGKPHEKSMHDAFPDCLKCHVDPHALAK
jgi:predicted CXXCH cytochrome family protein